MRAHAQRRGLAWLPSSFALAAAVALGGCASFGGNVRGDFSCAAPDGICAPSGMIDDRALAMISAEADGEAQPTVDRRRAPAKSARRVASAQPLRMSAAAPARTHEKVLRIVFQPYIDERGRLHEASAVRAVVSTGEWQQAFMEPAVGRPGFAAADTEPLAVAVERADPPEGRLATTSLAPPDPAAVAAARARAADPVGAIKSDVAARLAPPADRPRAVAKPGRSASGAPAGASLTPPAPVAASASPAAGVSAGRAQPGIAAAGAAALERVKADPGFTGIAGSVASDARTAAAKASPVAPAPTVRAPSFPATVQEDD